MKQVYRVDFSVSETSAIYEEYFYSNDDEYILSELFLNYDMPTIISIQAIDINS